MRTAKINIFSILILLSSTCALGASAFPSSAASAASCCLCSPPNTPDAKVCLGVEAIDAGAGCGKLMDTYKKLAGFSCSPPPANVNCADQTSAASLCPKGVVDIKAYIPPTQKSSSDEAVNKPVQAIKLGVPIPGVAIDTTIREQGGYAHVPFLAQYISGVYRYLIGISVVASAIMIVYGGFKYIAASSGAKVQSGRDIIQDAVIGLILLLGIVTILTIINPAATSFRPLRVTTIESKPWHGDEEGDIPHGQQGKTVPLKKPAPPGSTTAPAPTSFFALPKAVCQGTSCKELCNGCIAKPDLPDAPGIATPSSLTPIPKNSPGLSGGGFLRQEAVEALVLAGKAATGWPGGPYTLKIHSTARTLSEQVTLACGKFCQGNDTHVGTNVATPGGSIHGSGLAVDLELWKDKDKLVGCCDVASQTKVTREENAKLLQDIMGSVGWVRYCKEVWHFEWGTDTVPNRSKTCSWPPS